MNEERERRRKRKRKGRGVWGKKEGEESKNKEGVYREIKEGKT